MADQNKTVMLQKLPFMILENIFSHFPYVSMLKLSQVCVIFREVAIHRMRLGFAQLIPIITSKCAFFSGKCAQRFSSVVNGEMLDSYEYKNMQKMHIAMEMLLSEVRVLQAVCGRYENDPKWNYFCTFSGEVLDAVYKLISLNNYDDDSSYLFATVVLEATDKFLYHFLMHVVPDLNTNISYGIKVVDVLNCLRNCNLKSTATFTPNGTLFLNERYEFNKITYLMYPFDTHNFTTVEKKLSYILFMLAVNVRYYNFCFFIKQQTALEEIIIRGRRQQLTGLSNQLNHNKNVNEDVHSEVSRNTEWQQISPTEYFRERFIVNYPFDTGRLSFSCKLKLILNDRRYNYPLNMPFCTVQSPEVSPSPMYNFWIELRMTHLARASYEIKKSHIKIWSHNGGHELILQ